MDNKPLVTRVPARMKNPEAHQALTRYGEDWRERIAANLNIGKRVGKVKLTRVAEAQVGFVIEPLPHWFRTVINRLLSGVLRIILGTQIRNSLQVSKLSALTKTHVDIVLIEQY